MSDRVIVSTPAAPAALGPYSQAVRSGDMLFLSGQLGQEPTTGALTPGGVAAQTRRALENCRAVLEAAGFALADVVQAQVLLTDMGDFTAMNEVYAEYFPDNPPARAAFAVAGLPKGGLVEIVLTAKR